MGNCNQKKKPSCVETNKLTVTKLKPGIVKFEAEIYLDANNAERIQIGPIYIEGIDKLIINTENN